ncbi:MAG: alpha/beta hydrolase [Pseudomonadota bacterium]
MAARPKLRTHRIAGGGGTGLHVVETGPAEAPAILLIHGWSQHHLSWSKQLAGPLADEFRLVALDLRGHGASEKPDEPEAYQRAEGWAGDIAAILEALALERPVLVGWSMGGRVVGDYLTLHGEAAIAGVVLVGSGLRFGAHADPAVVAARKPDVQAEGTYSEDQRAQLDAAIGFLRASTGAPLSKRDLAFHVGAMMFCPPHIRRACRVRDGDYRAAYAALTRPALVVQGGAERVCLPPMFEETAATMPQAERLVLPGTGHMPFWEAPERFDAALAAFARKAHGTEKGVPA